MENYRKVKIVCNGIPEATLLRGSSSVRMTLDKFGIRNWREKAGNREDWKRVVNEAKARTEHQIRRITAEKLT